MLIKDSNIINYQTIRKINRSPNEIVAVRLVFVLGESSQKSFVDCVFILLPYLFFPILSRHLTKMKF